MSAHTPAPWDAPNKSVKIRGCSFLAQVHWEDDEAVANARLIAAAPDLLDAAQDAIKLIDDMARYVGKMALQDYALFNEAPIKLRAAIAKAVQP